MGSLFTELLYGFSVYRVVVWVLCLHSCCMGSRFTELLYENPYNNSVNREPIQQLCKQRTHTTTLSTENPYNNSVNREPIPVDRVDVWVLGLQSCCMGSRFTEFVYGFSVYRVVVWVLGLQGCCNNNPVNREPIQQPCK
jgi:hypothetical protein